MNFKPSLEKKKHLLQWKCLYVRRNSRKSERKIKEKIGKDKVGVMFCLVIVMKIMHFIIMENYAGEDIKKLMK